MRACASLLALAPTPALAQAAGTGGVNLTAITLFTVVVIGTLAITYWAAKRTKSASDV